MARRDADRSPRPPPRRGATSPGGTAVPRTGTVPGRAIRQRRFSPRRNEPLAVLAMLFLGVMVVLWLGSRLGFTGEEPVAVASTGTPSGSPGTTAFITAAPTVSPTAAPTPSPSPSPTATPSPSPSPTPSPTPSPSPSPTPTPSPTRPPTPSPSPTPAPPATPPSSGLIVLEPDPGTVVHDSPIDIRGLAPPGATITRDIPFWFDEHTTADAAGNWSFTVRLSPGDNDFTFRVGDDRNTAVRIIVRYEPRP